VNVASGTPHSIGHLARELSPALHGPRPKATVRGVRDGAAARGGPGAGSGIPRNRPDALSRSSDPFGGEPRGAL
jgi:hypothetical protein